MIVYIDIIPRVFPFVPIFVVNDKKMMGKWKSLNCIE